MIPGHCMVLGVWDPGTLSLLVLRPGGFGSGKVSVSFLKPVNCVAGVPGECASRFRCQASGGLERCNSFEGVVRVFVAELPRFSALRTVTSTPFRTSKAYQIQEAREPQ